MANTTTWAIDPMHSEVQLGEDIKLIANIQDAKLAEVEKV